MNLIVSAVLGGLFFCIWIVRREQSTYGWYALMALFWVLFIANVLVTSPWPFPTTLMAARANTMVMVLYVACFCIFTWRFGRQSLPRLEKALWILSAALLAAAAFTPDASLPRAQLIITLTVSAVFFANCLQFPLHALRTRRLEHGMLAACLLIFLFVTAHDLLLILKLIDEGNPYIPFSSLVVTLCMSAILGLRHARNVRRIERFNQELADGIFEARTELATTLEREHTLAMANTRLHERLQIAHDLHDGLGGSLVRMMAVVEQSHGATAKPAVPFHAQAAARRSAPDHRQRLQRGRQGAGHAQGMDRPLAPSVRADVRRAGTSPLNGAFRRTGTPRPTPCSAWR